MLRDTHKHMNWISTFNFIFTCFVHCRLYILKIFLMKIDMIIVGTQKFKKFKNLKIKYAKTIQQMKKSLKINNFAKFMEQILSRVKIQVQCQYFQ